MSNVLTFCTECKQMMIEYGVCTTCTLKEMQNCPYATRATRQARRDAENGAVLIVSMGAVVAVVMFVLVALALSSGGNLTRSDMEQEYRAEVASREAGLHREGLQP